jgi:phosphohistidine phosphatase
LTPVHVYLVRHGEANSKDVDPERHLSGRGADQVRQIATDAVSDLGVRPALVVHSGNARARETAEIWSGLIGADTAEGDGLAPNDDPSIWATRLEAEADDVMLVGHLPHLERLVGLLVTGDADAAVAGFPAGGLVGLERTGDGWVVSAARP